MEKETKTSESLKRAIKKYQDEKTRFYGFRLNCGTDAELISLLDQQTNKQGFIKTALRKYCESLPQKEK